MYFGFALELSNVDLLNIDLLDTHLDLLDQLSPVSILLVSIMSSRRLHDMSSRHHQDMSSRRLQRNNFSSSKTSSGGLQDAFKTSCEIFCYAQDILLR